MEKIIWALDVFGNKAQQLRAAETLKAFSKGKATIEPVMVLSPDQLKVPTNAFSKHAKEYKLEADKLLRGWLKGVKIPGLIEPTFLVSESFSRKGSVSTLLSYAKQSNASLIALSTRAEKGLMHLLLGSFAETLLLQTTIPVLIVNPKTTTQKKLTSIIYPTDLSANAARALKEVTLLAKNLGAKLTLYHKLEYMVPETIAAIHQAPIYDKYLEEDTKAREEKLKELVAEVKKSGVGASYVFDKKPGFVTDAILKLSKKEKSALIAMASQTGPVASAVLGSVTRQVIRATRTPVWVVHISQ